jgi:hypothetical protein
VINMSEYKSDPPACPAGSQISPELSQPIEHFLDGKVRELSFSFALAVDEFDVDPCAFCEAPIAHFQLASGRWYAAELENEQGITRAVLTSPHRCAASIRFDDFVAADSPEPEPEVAEL